ncbi:MAG: NUDIX hydrolase [Anaerolineae bacterium]|jgi:8-oxo-dGTP pyrophosphatase MutT (NUDIX family)|nr:NUDIX hydrolase [Anaerolineae bacterium]
MKNWKKLRSEQGENLRIANVRFDTWKNPRNGVELKATVLEMTDWVNIVALTPEGKILVVKQFRLGTESVTIETPAGVMEEGEDSQVAAMRELAEETGYTTNDWTYLGWVEPNPAFQNNLCHQFLAKDIIRTHDTAQDEGEDIVFSEMTLDEVKNEIREGRMRNSLSLLTLSRVFDIWE